MSFSSSKRLMRVWIYVGKTLLVNKKLVITLGFCTEISLHDCAYRATSFYNAWHSLRRQCKWIAWITQKTVWTSGFIWVHRLLYFGGKRFFSSYKFFFGSCKKRDSSCITHYALLDAWLSHWFFLNSGRLCDSSIFNQVKMCFYCWLYKLNRLVKKEAWNTRIICTNKTALLSFF